MKFRSILFMFVSLMLLLGLTACSLFNPAADPDNNANEVGEVNPGETLSPDNSQNGDTGSSPTTNPDSDSPTNVDLIQPAPIVQHNLPLPIFLDPPSKPTVETGVTIRHRVGEGEWLLQISRCYGADYTAVRQANPQVFNPDFLIPEQTLITVPNTGSESSIIGPPCVQRVAVREGESWQSLAQTYQTTATILQNVNPGLLTVGRTVYVPTSAPTGPGPVPSFNRDLLFEIDGNLAVWQSDDGRVALYPDAATILDLTTNGVGDFVLIKRLSGDDFNLEYALIDRAQGTVTPIESNLPSDWADAESPFIETMLISANSQWGAYITGKDGRFKITTFATDAPAAAKSLDINHGNDELPPRLFIGADNDHFLWLDNSGIYELDYALTEGEKQLQAVNSDDYSTPNMFEGVSWSPAGRYLLLKGFFLEGSVYFVFDKESGQLLDLPGSGGYVSFGAAAWMMDGTAVVISPPADPGNNPRPLYAVYKPEIIDNTLTLTAVGDKISLAPSSRAGQNFAYGIASPPMQTSSEQTIMAFAGEPGSLWAAQPNGNGLTMKYLNELPANFWRLDWLPDGSGVLIESLEQGDTPGDVAYVGADGSRPFSLLNWLDFKISNFHWVNPSDPEKLTANCFPETLIPQGDICFFLFGKPVANNPTAIDLDTIELSVGLGPAMQTIEVSQETAVPFEAASLIVEDMNYDGYDDFRIVEFLPASPNIPFLTFIYDEASNQFAYSEAFKNITSPEIIGNKQIRSQWRAGAANWGVDVYTVVEGVPVLTEREEWEAINETEARHRLTFYDAATNTSEVIVDEVGPIP